MKKKISFIFLLLFSFSFLLFACNKNENSDFNFRISKDNDFYVVYGNNDLIEECVIPKMHKNLPVKAIGFGAFINYINLKSVTIPDSIEKIDNSSFYNCTSLENVIIPDSIKTIGKMAFNNCSSLTKITIPNSVTEISVGLFTGCDSLESIVVDENNKVYDSRENSNAIIETSSNTLISGCKNSIIPNNITKIEENAFQDCKNLKNITVPNSVKEIGDYAFSGCSSLENIVLPNDIAKIGSYTFKDCSSLKKIEIPASVVSIEREAFLGCKSLEGIVVDKNNGIYDSRENSNAIIETNTDTLILGCKNTIIPNTVKTIGSESLVDSSLKELIIPASVISISSFAFYYSNSLESIIVDKNNEVYDSRENSNAIIETATNSLILGCKNTVIPNDVEKIDYLAFAGCKTIESITIPNNVTEIGISAFQECKNLKNVVLPNGLISIARSTFAFCESLESIEIPASVNYIRLFAFSDCSALKNVTLSKKIPEIDRAAFSGSTNLETITYLGTKEEWSKEEKTDAFERFIGTLKIKCTDGEINYK